MLVHVHHKIQIAHELEFITDRLLINAYKPVGEIAVDAARCERMTCGQDDKATDGQIRLQKLPEFKGMLKLVSCQPI